ncbi:MAG: hypothetical protein ACXAD7_08910, partial [Candidatus Kariarchaeaceae archaeon]
MSTLQSEIDISLDTNQSVSSEVENINTLVNSNTIDNSGENLLTLENINTSQINFIQQSINTDDHPITNGSQLHFATLIDYNIDGNMDVLFVVEHETNPLFQGFSLLILDGLNFNVLFEAPETVEDRYEYTFQFKYGHFSLSNQSDIVFFFRSHTLYGLLLLDTLNFDTFFSPYEYETFENIVDFNGDGFDDYIGIDNFGNYFTIDLKASLESKVKIQDEGNLHAQELSGELRNLVFGNFTNDNFLDYSYTQVGNPGILQYFIDGSNGSIFQNTSLPAEIYYPQVINLDSKESDEILAILGTEGKLVALNSSGLIDYYNQYQSGSLPKDFQLITDIDADFIPDFILTYENGLTIIFSGKSGIPLSVSPIMTSLTNTLPNHNTISVAVIDNQPIIITQKTYHNLREKSKYRSNVIKLDTGSKLQFWDFWSQQTPESNIIFNTKLYTMNFINIELNQDIDHDGLTSFDEYYLGTDDINFDTDNDIIPDLNETIRGINPLLNDTDYDLIPDWNEIDLNLNPSYNDAENDNDADEVINYFEYRNNTDPNNPDTDNDGMPDG